MDEWDQKLLMKKIVELVESRRFMPNAIKQEATVDGEEALVSSAKLHEIFDILHKNSLVTWGFKADRVIDPEELA